MLLGQIFQEAPSFLEDAIGRPRPGPLVDLGGTAIKLSESSRSVSTPRAVGWERKAAERGVPTELHLAAVRLGGGKTQCYVVYVVVSARP